MSSASASQTSDWQWDDQHQQYRRYDYGLQRWVWGSETSITSSTLAVSPTYSSGSGLYGDPFQGDDGFTYGPALGPNHAAVDAAPLSRAHIAQETNKANPLAGDASELEDDAIHLRGKTFKRERSTKFTPSTVFQCLWTTVAGSSQRRSGTTVVEHPAKDHFGQQLFSEIRTFVVLQDNEDYSSTCLRICTYGGRGVSGTGLRKSNHAIIHTGSRVPGPLAIEAPRRGEHGMRTPIRVKGARSTDKLDPKSRINLRARHTIDHNSRIYIVGRVADDSWNILMTEHRAVIDYDRDTVVNRLHRLRNAPGIEQQVIAPAFEDHEFLAHDPAILSFRAAKHHLLEGPEQHLKEDFAAIDYKRVRPSAKAAPVSLQGSSHVKPYPHSAAVTMAEQLNGHVDTPSRIEKGSPSSVILNIHHPESAPRPIKDNDPRNKAERPSTRNAGSMHLDSEPRSALAVAVECPVMPHQDPESLISTHEGSEIEVKTERDSEIFSQHAEEALTSEFEAWMVDSDADSAEDNSGVRLDVEDEAQPPLDHADPIIGSPDTEIIPTTNINPVPIAFDLPQAVQPSRPVISATDPVTTARRITSFMTLCFKLVDAIKPQLNLFSSAYPRLARSCYYRVQWRCACGELFHQDFPKSDLDAARKLFMVFSDCGYETRIARQRPQGPAAEQSGSAGTPPAARPDSNVTQSQSSSGDAASLRTLVDDGPRDHFGPHNPAVDAANWHEDKPCTVASWLLLCFDYYKILGKAAHIPVTNETEDEILVSKLKTVYLSSRSYVNRTFSWTKVCEITFIKFRLRYDRRLRDGVVLKCGDWDPPKPWDRAQEWSPRPIGERPTFENDEWLLHLWDHPHDTRMFKLKKACLNASIRGINSLQMTLKPVRRVWLGLRAYFRPLSLDERLNRARPTDSNEEGGVQLETMESTGPSDSRSCAILALSPVKVEQQLQPSITNPPYGWGIYLQEGFAIPESICALATFFMFCLIFGVLMYCAGSVARWGMDVFGLLEATIAFCALVAMFLIKYSDVR